MKFLDVVIIVLLVLVLGSGGFLLYSVIQNDSEIPPIDDQATLPQTNDVEECTDRDGDRYGPGCDLGPDCDEDDKNRNVKCETVSGVLGLEVTNEGTVPVGEIVMLDVYVSDLSQVHSEATSLELRLDYDTDKLSFSSFENVSEEYSPYIDLETDTRVEVDVVNINGIAEGDQIMTLAFQAIAPGEVNFEIAEDTRVEIIYKVMSDTTTSLVIGDDATNVDEMMDDSNPADEDDMLDEEVEPEV